MLLGESVAIRPQVLDMIGEWQSFAENARSRLALGCSTLGPGTCNKSCLQNKWRQCRPTTVRDMIYKALVSDWVLLTESPFKIFGETFMVVVKIIR